MNDSTDKRGSGGQPGADSPRVGSDAGNSSVAGNAATGAAATADASNPTNPFTRMRTAFKGVPGGRFISADASRTVRHSIARKRTTIDWLAFALMMAGAVAIMFVNLTANGYANEFYAAAAQAGSKNWEAFLWGSSDAANSITVDKPPAALWLMALSVRLLGLSSFAILLPEALCGVLSVWLLYVSVRRYWGNWAGIIAGSTLALTPVAALMFRFDNPDALLVLLMIAASASVLRALEYDPARKANRKRTLWLALAGVCIGFGFLTKQMQVFLVLPGFALAILIASPTKFWRRVADSLVALAAMVVSAGWWVLLTVIVPSGSRPYIGGSQNDSFLELTFGYNGFGRLTGNETGSVVPGGGGGGKASKALGNAYSAMTGGMAGGPGGGQTGGGQGGGMWGQTGITRLFDGVYGTQIAWLAPIAFAGVVIGLAVSLRVRRTDMRRAGVMVWGGWLVVTWLTFSFMGGIFHQYYTVALAPAVAVMVAVAVRTLWEHRRMLWSRVVATLLVLGNTLWAAELLSRSTWLPWLRVAVLVVGGFATIALLITVIAALPIRSLRAMRSGNGGKAVRNIGLVGIVLATVALYAGPVAWTGYTVATGHHGSIVTAGPEVTGSMGGGPGGGHGGQGSPGGAAGMGGPGGQGDGQTGQGSRGNQGAQGGPGAGFGGANNQGNQSNQNGQTNSSNGSRNNGGSAGGPSNSGNSRSANGANNAANGSNSSANGSASASNGSNSSNSSANGNGLSSRSFDTPNATGADNSSDSGASGFGAKDSGKSEKSDGASSGMPGASNSSKNGSRSGQNRMSHGGVMGHGGGLTGGDGSSSVGSKLKKLLMKDAGKYTWVAAATGSQSASGYQLATQQPVMPIGGFNGSDPSPTLAQFKRYVKEGKIHYYIGGEMGGGMDGSQMGGSNASSQIATWVKSNFKSQTVDGVTLYDLTSPKATE
ncbi:glycosyltransferase family 39 protein [Bifidobacterium sp. ESL0790]|uniref:ArnT family glycosyltransferase n=1 Tax=Bifidobacterium sp. ESL0790 TaxID=2983233 RepID=UPI0023F96169|nr:glycosyltransferase family 39 protein [Bifidobacterium sp. ESL0790]WEV72280.1 glycosyltransferase family 39 protein [Bifidobacterium sp. ESL0790]